MSDFLPSQEQADALLQAGHISPDLHAMISSAQPQANSTPIDTTGSPALNIPTNDAQPVDAGSLPYGVDPSQVSPQMQAQMSASPSTPSGASGSWDAPASPAQSGDGTKPTLASFSPTMAPKGADGAPSSAPSSDNTLAGLQMSGLKGINSAFDSQQAGIAAKAAAEGEAGTKSGQALDALNANLQKMDAQAQQRAQASRADLDGMQKSIMDTKIDPNRFWNNLDTGQRVQAGIALALGGLAQGVSGGKVSNAAADTIQNSISRDIDSQKVDLGKKQTVYGNMLEKYKDDRAADLATRSNAISVAQNQVQSILAKAQSPIAIANGKILMGQLDQTRAGLNTEFGMRMYQLQQKSNLQGGASGINAEALPAEDRDRIVRLPSGNMGLAYTKEDANHVKETLGASDELQSTLNEMKSFQKEVGTTLPYSTNDNRAEALRNRAIAQVNHLAGLTRLSGEDIGIILKQLPNPGAMRQGAASAQLDNLNKLIASKVQSTLEQRVQGFNKPVTSFKPI